MSDLYDDLPFTGLSPAPLNGDGADVEIIAETLRLFELRALPPAESLVGAPRDGTNLLPRYGWVMPWGPAGAGKTSILVDLLFHTCCGIDWLGYHVERPLRILAIVNEGVPGALQDKLVQKRERWEHDTEVVRDNLAIFVAPWGEFTFRDKRLVDYARDYARDFGADYVALDPLHTVSTVTAGAPDETEKFKHELRAFGVWDDVGIITAHHSNKAGMISGDWARHADTVFHIVKEPKQPASRYTLEKARPADPNELGMPCILEWQVETLGYVRRTLDTTKTDDAELLERIRVTLAEASEPLTMRTLREGTKGSDERLSEVVREALKAGEILDVSTRKDRYGLILAERRVEFGAPDEPLPLAEALPGMVEPEQRFVPPDEPPKSALRAGSVVRGASPSLEGAHLDEPHREGDDGDDIPSFGVPR